MKRRQTRAVLLLQPTPDKARSEALERALLMFAAAHHYLVTALASDPAAAAALAEDGLCDVVVVYRHSRVTLEMAGRVGQTDATVDEVSPSRAPLFHRDGTRDRILDASRRGVSAEAIAAVLDVPLSTVHEALGADDARRPQRTGTVRSISSARRPRRVGGPPGRA